MGPARAAAVAVTVTTPPCPTSGLRPPPTLIATPGTDRSSRTVATKIAATVQALGLARFDMMYSNGALPHDALMSSLELSGTRVLPRVRELLA